MPKPIPDRQPDTEWEALLQRQLPRGKDEPQSALPGQWWATAKNLDQPRTADTPGWHYETGGIFLGFRGGKAIGRTDDRHVLVCCGSRSGKGVSVIKPAACLWPGSLVVVDPKGDVAVATVRTRTRDLRQPVFVLDPFGRAAETGLSHAFNPLAEIYPPGLTGAAREAAAIDNAELIADSIIIPNEREPHWTDSARYLIKGLILYTLTLPPEEQNLLTVRDLLTFKHPAARPQGLGDGKKIDRALYAELASCEAFGGEVQGVGWSFLAKPEEERGSIISTAIAQTSFLSSPALKNCITGKSSFRLADLKRQNITLYLCLPASRMGTHARWLRVIINMILNALEDTPASSPHPVLLCLDEFNVLGKMPKVSDAAGQMAGFGCKLMIVLQDITQLKEHYRHTWETFVGNSGLFITFGNSDVSTLDYISKKLGTCTVAAETTSTPGLSASLGGASGNSVAPKSVALLAPHEVERIFARERERVSVLYPGMRPIILKRCISHKDPFFTPLLDDRKPQQTTPAAQPGGFRPKFT